MHDFVQTSLCNQHTLEHIVPIRGWQLAGENGCLSVVTVIYDLLKIVMQLSFQPDHSKVIYDCLLQARNANGYASEYVVPYVLLFMFNFWVQSKVVMMQSFCTTMESL